MRTRKTLCSAMAALALFCAAGCCETAYIYTRPDGTETVVEAKQIRKVTRRPARRAWRCYPCDETASVAGATVTAPAVEATPQSGATVLRRGRKGRIVRYREEGELRRIVAQPAAPAPVVVAAPAPVVVAEPVAVVEAVDPEPIVVAVEEPSWAQYLAPEQSAAIPAEPYAVPYAAGAPLYAAPLPMTPDGRQPIVIQPIIQPVVQPLGQAFTQPQPVQFGQEVLGGQTQGLTPQAAPETAYPVYPTYPAYPEQSSLGIPPALPGGALLVGPQAGYYATYPAGMYGEGNPLAALYANPFGPSPVCPPGANCFTLPESQLAGGPQVIVPNAAGSAGVSGVTALASAPAEMPAIPPAAPGLQDKYGALTPVGDDAARQVSRPEVSMPAPLGGTTVPPVVGTAEIENALDFMLGEPVLK